MSFFSFSLYLKLNLLIGISYFLFEIIGKYFSTQSKKVRYQVLLRNGQILLLASVVIPTLLQFTHVYVALENPTDVKGVHGSVHAAPLFKEVAEKTLQYFKVPTL
jgi:hypothetical protein